MIVCRAKIQSVVLITYILPCHNRRLQVRRWIICQNVWGEVLKQPRWSNLQPYLLPYPPSFEMLKYDETVEYHGELDINWFRFLEWKFEAFRRDVKQSQHVMWTRQQKTLTPSITSISAIFKDVDIWQNSWISWVLDINWFQFLGLWF